MIRWDRQAMSTAIERFAPRLPVLDRVTRVDQVGVEERVARFCTRSIKKDSKIHALRLALSMIDLTTLEGQDTPGKVTQLCRKAVHLHDGPAGPAARRGGVRLPDDGGRGSPGARRARHQGRLGSYRFPERDGAAQRSSWRKPASRSTKAPTRSTW